MYEIYEIHSGFGFGFSRALETAEMLAETLQAFAAAAGIRDTFGVRYVAIR